MEPEKELKLLRESWTETFDQLFVLYEVAREVSSVLDVDSILDHIINHAFLLLESEGACVFLLNHETSRLDLRVIKGERNYDPKKKGLNLSLGEGIAGEVAKTGKPVIFTQEPGEKMFREDSVIFGIPSPRNLVCVPIVLRGGEVTGVIEIVNKKKGTFTSKDRDFLMAIANISALSIENARVYKRLKSVEIYQSQVIENLPEGFMSFNAAGRLTYMNACAKELLGLEGKTELAGQSYAAFFKDEPDLMGHIEAALFQSKAKRWQEVQLKKARKSVFLFTFIIKQTDNSVLGVGVVIQSMILKR